MNIEHVAIWVKDLEKMKAFYEAYFKGKAGSIYVNPAKQFSSYFLTFENGCRLELIHKPGLSDGQPNAMREASGISHLAFSVGSKQTVDQLTQTLRNDGYQIADGPRTTGDGYYESVILDPEGNRVEITV